jgi:protein-tyrosine kinase
MSRIDKAIEKATALRGIVNEPRISGTHPVNEHVCDGALLLNCSPLAVNNPSIVCASADAHPAAEEYRKLKSVILQLTSGAEFRNTLLVTSALSGEGKSVTAINLACALARDYDHTVLLVDTDLRRPTVHKYLNFEPEVGLIQCLKGNVPLEDALVKTGLGKLVVLPAGGIADDPNEMLASDQMKALVDEMKNRYSDRYIVFDTPPALLFADAQALSDHVDSVLFVVREGASRPSQIKSAVDCLRGSALLGVVYNDALQIDRKSKYFYY